VILGYFPLHDEVWKNQLRAKWVTWAPPAYYPMDDVGYLLGKDWHQYGCSLPLAVWEQPLEDVREYFGEKVTMYFAWLGHYTKWLVLVSLLGVVVQINVIAEYTDFSATLTAPYGLFVTLWCTFFTEAWKRKEIYYAMKWGTIGTSSESSESRPEYKGRNIDHSPIDGKPTIWFSQSERNRFIIQSVGAISVMILAVVIVLAGIFGFRYWTVDKSGNDDLATVGPGLASIANAVQIQVLGGLYKSVAEKLNDRENHRTDAEYENSLIAKQFLFQFCNSYAALFYIAFVKSVIGDVCVADNCVSELFIQLMTIFGIRLVVGNIQEILLPKIITWNKKRVEQKNAAELGGPEIEPSDAEDQFVLAAYGDDGLFEDYLEMVVQFGYSTLFVTAAPLAPLMSLLNNYVEIRIDGMKMTDNTQRPEPKGAENIGTWGSVLEIMGTMAVLTNVGIIMFTNKGEPGQFDRPLDTDPDSAPSTAWGIFYFLAIEHVIICLKFGLELYIPDIPEEVAVQLQRSEFCEKKLIKFVPDDVDVDTKGLQRKVMAYNISSEGIKNNS